ncbi:hypothetical protein ACSVH2_00725 [Flavobacterium sp. RSB2_4_14]|uniref:hypothetical protein n=1 Tax=Flavobacterium sp. RSB2_4_14 TaxID=3447665 RepID=UPI003F2D613B
MKKVFHSVAFMLLLLLSIFGFGQEKVSNDPDFLLKETLYKKYKKEIQAYDKKEFEDLFFEYFQKHNDKNLTLTKEEYYTYTIKIAAYSERLGLLYKEQKEDSQRTKQVWFDKRYSDYLVFKKQ